MQLEHGLIQLGPPIIDASRNMHTNRSVRLLKLKLDRRQKKKQGNSVKMKLGQGGPL